MSCSNVFTSKLACCFLHLVPFWHLAPRWHGSPSALIMPLASDNFVNTIMQLYKVKDITQLSVVKRGQNLKVIFFDYLYLVVFFMLPQN